MMNKGPKQFICDVGIGAGWIIGMWLLFIKTDMFVLPLAVIGWTFVWFYFFLIKKRKN